MMEKKHQKAAAGLMEGSSHYSEYVLKLTPNCQSFWHTDTSKMETKETNKYDYK